MIQRILEHLWVFWGFVLAIAENEVPSTKAPDPYMHLFLDAGGGNILAFFELPTKPAMGKMPCVVRRSLRGFPTLLRLPVIKQLIGIVDGSMDLLHRVYEKLIHWAFSGRRYRLFVPPILRSPSVPGRRRRR